MKTENIIKLNIWALVITIIFGFILSLIFECIHVIPWIIGTLIFLVPMTLYQLSKINKEE